MRRIKHSRLLIIALFFYYPLTLFALPEDSKEKIYIVADTTTYNYKAGLTDYQGHVKVDQGTTHITADRLTTKADTSHHIQEAIAYGITTLAEYSTIPKMGDPLMHASAKIIKFYPMASNVTLEQTVHIMQGENNFQGQLILYNRNDQTIIVPAANKGRAVLVYNPDNSNL